MNFLQLSQRLLQETGIADSGLTQVTGQTGDNKRLVDWINESWLRIQSARSDWNFMWANNTATTTVGSSLFTLPADVQTVIDFELAGSPIQFISWPIFRDLYRDLRDGQPTAYTVLPSGVVMFNATPDAQYAIDYEYFKIPAYMSANTDVPSISERFHMLIVWGALLEYALFDEASELAQKAQMNYTKIFAELVQAQTPDMSLPSSLV